MLKLSLTRGKKLLYSGVGLLALAGLVYGAFFSPLASSEYRSQVAERLLPLPTLDTADYNARLLALAHASTSTVEAFTGVIPAASTTPYLWPVKAVYPQVGALLPFHRILAYYGNFYSRGMGVLGEYPSETLLPMLQAEVEKWNAADPSTPVLPAIQYIVAVAQGSAGKEGKYILRMPDDQIEHALDLANQVHGIVILDVQVAQSTLEHELPMIEKYLQLPQVHLAIDPEFSMKFGDRPGTVIGTFDASDINYAAQFLARIVSTYHLPPKVLVIHRFTQDMVTNYTQIMPLPEVQIVMDMDGFGSKAKKYGTYNRVIVPEPVQFTGIKLFYRNDVRPPADGVLTPEEVLKLTPAPIYIQYQ